jgi:hypothetical protein
MTEDFLDLAAPRPSGRALGTMSTLVSLFLLLLVFFIVLFSISQVRQQRVDEIVTSIDRAFGGVPSRLGLLPKPVPPADEAAAESFVRDATQLLTGFPPTEVPAAAGSTLLSVALAPERLFAGAGADLTLEGKRLIPPLAVLMQRHHGARLHYRLTIRASMPAADPAAASARERLAALAAALFAAGCPADRLAIGTDPGAGDRVRFDFATIGTGEDQP